MASEYLKKKYQDVKPDEPVVLTKKQKWENWWFYHKVHVLIALGAAVLIGLGVRDIVNRELPDYEVALIGSEFYLSQETLDAVAQRVEDLGEDCNDDDEVLVYVNPYLLSEDGRADYMSPVKLTADLAGGMSTVFILEDPVDFQSTYEVLMQRDGSPFTPEDDPADCLYYRWSDCPALSDLDLGGEFYLARRFRVEGEPDPVEGLWNNLTKGAVPVNGD